VDAERKADDAVSRLAAAIGEPARARMLYCLMDERARTSTELSVVANVSPSTASVHLNRLRSERLVRMQVHGKHHYYTLGGIEVANVLEGLSVLVGSARGKFVPTTPHHLRAARTCYDHIAGALGVSLHDRLATLGWLVTAEGSYDLTPKGTAMLEALGIDVVATRLLRRRFAFGCLDWSERRCHLGGALAAALLKLAMQRKWLTRDLDSRALRVTPIGQVAMRNQFGLDVSEVF
jgi:DNA-binding transcriptional ArsR family regulator